MCNVLLAGDDISDMSDSRGDCFWSQIYLCSGSQVERRWLLLSLTTQSWVFLAVNSLSYQTYTLEIVPLLTLFEKHSMNIQHIDEYMNWQWCVVR